MGDVKVPPTNFQGVRSGQGAALPTKFLPPPRFYSNLPENRCPSRLKTKKNCSCILKSRLTTNPILSALHLQGLKANIYICALPPSK